MDGPSLGVAARTIMRSFANVPWSFSVISPRSGDGRVDVIIGSPQMRVPVGDPMHARS
jgi:hypothetical protein